MKQPEKRTWKGVLRIAGLILCAVILGVNVYQWNARSLTGNVLPMPFGYGAAVVLTGSMEPTIMTNELILVKAQEQYEVGDVVVYQSGSILVVHRIMDMEGDLVTTKGDANNTADDPVDLSCIKGEVIGHIPHVGSAVRLIKTPAVSVALVIGAVLLVELPFRKKKKTDNEELERIKEEIRRLKEEQQH